MSEIKIHYPLNRVEGDLKVYLEIKDHTINNAWTVGTMYRGFENIMIGRGPLDGLVLTPRICGICSTSHLNAAAKALDMIFTAEVPDNAKRVRNAAVMVEQLQSDLRHMFMLFMPDFTNPGHKDSPLFDELVKRYTPMSGQTCRQVIHESKKLLQIIGILGGQWPHSSFMIPGGVVSIPNPNEILQCRHILKGFKIWYEQNILGCSLDEVLAIDSQDTLYAWADAKKSHFNSDLGLFIRTGREMDLNRLGTSYPHFLSYGAHDLPIFTQVKGLSNTSHLVPSGFWQNGESFAFFQEKITEDISHSWFSKPEDGKHPFISTTQPYATGSEGKRYSWAKAPRYDGFPAETGPLAEMIVSGSALFQDLVKKVGASVFSRELARMLRPAIVLPVLDCWLNEMAKTKEDFFIEYEDIENGKGYGLIQAPRGALGHWVKIINSRIDKYQIITPSTWNASPRDADGVRGPMEEALTGTPVKDPKNPVEVDHIVRSFDPCLVCTVHAIDLRHRTLTQNTYQIS